MNTKVIEALREREKRSSSKKTNKKVESALEMRETRNRYNNAINSYNERLNAVDEAIKNLAYPTYSDIDTIGSELDTFMDSVSANRTELYALQKQAWGLRDIIGEDKAKEAISSLDELIKGYDTSMSDARSQKAYLNSDEYKKLIEDSKKQAEWQEMANSEQGAIGWDKYLADERAIQEATEAERADESFWEKLGRWLGGGVVDTTLPNAGVTQAIQDLRNDESYKKPTDSWSKEEQNIFGYLYSSDPKEAFEYATIVNNNYNKEAEEAALKKIMESASSNFWSGLGNTLGALITAPLGLAVYLNDLALGN
jgi:hypothetical protein